MCTRILGIIFLFCTFGSAGYGQSFPDHNGKSSPDPRNFRKESSYTEAIDFNNVDFERINAVIFYLTNETRTKFHLKPLLYAPELEHTAMMHANDMIRGDFFSHLNEKDPQKRTPNDRARLCNISNPYLSENIIEGFGLQYKAHETVYLRGSGKFSKSEKGELIKPHTYLSLGEALIAGWMNSPEHRKNMLSKDAMQIGCGSAKFINHDFNDMPTFYVVQNFQCYQPIENINP